VRHHTEAVWPKRDNRITPETRATNHAGIERVIMNKHIWGGIIMWGIFVTFFGLGAMNPVQIAAPDQEVIFLLAGGLVTCLIGVIGLVGVMARIPAFNKQSGAAARYRRA
jgi:hypothetical protein